jgi:integrase/recombinase XerD
MRKVKTQKTVAALTQDQLEKILTLSKEKSARDHAMILLQYWHGLRVSELVGLKLSGLDRRQKVWSLNVARLKGSLRTEQFIGDAKGKPVWSERKALENYIENERGESASEYVFLSKKTGGPLDPAVWNRLFKSYVLLAGLPESLSHNHILKHSLARHLLAGGANLEQVRQSLGHSSLNSTAIYIRTTDQDADSARRKLMESLP